MTVAKKFAASGTAGQGERIVPYLPDEEFLQAR